MMTNTIENTDSIEADEDFEFDVLNTPTRLALAKVMELLDIRRYEAELDQKNLAEYGDEHDWAVAVGHVAGLTAAMRSVRRVMQDVIDAGG